MTVSKALKKCTICDRGPRLLRLCRLSGRLGIIRRKPRFQSAPFQQRLDVSIAPHKILEQTQRISRAAATEQCLPKAIASLALSSARSFDSFHAVRIEHLAP